MALPPVDAALAEFKPEDYTVRLVNGVFKVIPHSPTLTPYRALEDAVRTVHPQADAILFAKARQASVQQDVLDVLWMANLLDSGDKGYALFTGLKGAFNLVRGAEGAMETDPQQRNDAVLKGLGIAYMAYNAFPGSLTERVEAFRTTPAGQALLMYYAAVEIALPFADNAVDIGGNFVQQLFAKEGAGQFSRLSSLAGGKSLEGAMGMFTAMTGGVQRVVDTASKYTKPVAEAAKQYAPGALSAGDKIAGAVATAADVMPVYRYLGGRLAAEGAAWRALKA